MIMKDNKENPNEFKKDLHEWLAVMKAKQEASRKREAEEAYWNQPLNLKDRDQKDYEKRRNGIDKRKRHLDNQVERWIQARV